MVAVARDHEENKDKLELEMEEQYYSEEDSSMLFKQRKLLAA